MQVGFIANLHGERSHKIMSEVRNALVSLCVAVTIVFSRLQCALNGAELPSCTAFIHSPTPRVVRHTATTSARAGSASSRMHGASRRVLRGQRIWRRRRCHEPHPLEAHPEGRPRRRTWLLWVCSAVSRIALYVPQAGCGVWKQAGRPQVIACRCIHLYQVPLSRTAQRSAILGDGRSEGGGAHRHQESRQPLSLNWAQCSKDW